MLEVALVVVRPFRREEGEVDEVLLLVVGGHVVVPLLEGRLAGGLDDLKMTFGAS